jgi:hypothetical protein
VDEDDPPLFESYVVALVDGKRLPLSVGYLVLSMPVKRGQRQLFAHEEGQVVLVCEAQGRAKEMLCDDGWTAAELLLHGYSVADAAVELVLPAALVKTLLDRLKGVAEKAFSVDDESALAA